jgi:hypothetical protein
MAILDPEEAHPVLIIEDEDELRDVRSSRASCTDGPRSAFPVRTRRSIGCAAVCARV